MIDEVSAANPFFAKIAYICLVNYYEDDYDYVFTSTDSMALLDVLRILRRWGLAKEKITQKEGENPEIRIDCQSFRHCDVCGEPLNEGYCADMGAEYYCCDKCLHTHYTEEEWEQECENNEQSYCTIWDSPYYD